MTVLDKLVRDFNKEGFQVPGQCPHRNKKNYIQQVEYDIYHLICYLMTTSVPVIFLTAMEVEVMYNQPFKVIFLNIIDNLITWYNENNGIFIAYILRHSEIIFNNVIISPLIRLLKNNDKLFKMR